MIDDPLVGYSVLPFPAHHRELWPGEKLREGDKFIRPGMRKWEEISSTQIGQLVEELDEENLTRFCRPIHPRSQNLYVDLRPNKGRADATGSRVDPFDSIANARRAIEALAAQNGEPFYLGRF